MLENIIDYLREVNCMSIVVRLMLAILCGGVIGFERGRKGKAAGFRTHILVCIGSTLVMITNQYIVQNMNFEGDPTRLGAQVISGIGFLGAGTIVFTGKQHVSGLTTAAGLWASACMGLAIGIGFYEGALIGCIFIFCSMTLLQRFDNYAILKTKELQLLIQLETIKDTRSVINIIHKKNFELTNVEVLGKESAENIENIMITVIRKENEVNQELMDLIRAQDNVMLIREC